jgi:hypothetical protein
VFYVPDDPPCQGLPSSTMADGTPSRRRRGVIHATPQSSQNHHLNFTPGSESGTAFLGAGAFSPSTAQMVRALIQQQRTPLGGSLLDESFDEDSPRNMLDVNRGGDQGNGWLHDMPNPNGLREYSSPSDPHPRNSRRSRYSNSSTRSSRTNLSPGRATHCKTTGLCLLKLT